MVIHKEFAHLESKLHCMPRSTVKNSLLLKGESAKISLYRTGRARAKDQKDRSRQNLEKLTEISNTVQNQESCRESILQNISLQL